MKKTIANLFNKDGLVASFTEVGKASRYAEMISSLNSSIPEAYRPTWQSHTLPNRKTRYTLMGTGYYIEEFDLDPVLSLSPDPVTIDGELGSTKLEYTDVIEYDDGA